MRLPRAILLIGLFAATSLAKAATVGVLFLYTPSAFSYFGLSLSALTSSVNNEVAIMNSVFTNSHYISSSVVSRGVQSVAENYLTCTVYDALDDPEIADKRDATNNTDVIIIITGSGGCVGPTGNAVVGQAAESPADFTSAVAVVMAQQLSTERVLRGDPKSFVVSHEFGHLMGALHDNTSFTTNWKGYADPGTNCVKDIMAATLIDCAYNHLNTRVNVYSNPDLYGIYDVNGNFQFNHVLGDSSHFAAYEINQIMGTASAWHLSKWTQQTWYQAARAIIVNAALMVLD